MTIFTCEICDYTTHINSNYHKHLRTNKHQKKVLQKESQTLNNKNTKKVNIYPKKGQKSIPKEFVCDYCSKEFTTKAHLNRHVHKSCQGNNTQSHLLDIIEKQNKALEDMQNRHLKEKQILFEKMDILLDHIGDTTNHITNNKIILNCYGNEDYSHITDTLKNNLLKIPYAMIPKFIQELHFNKPENKNIFLPNKNKPHVMVFTDNKWTYKDKKSAIKELVDKNFSYLDSYYQNGGSETLDEPQKKRYNEFHDRIVDDEGPAHDKAVKDTEIILLNEKK